MTTPYAKPTTTVETLTYRASQQGDPKVRERQLTQKIRQLYILAGLLLLAALPSKGNNLTITGMSVVSPNQVRFTISWDNSWFISGFNWDAVWIFVKAQQCAGTTTWDHVDLSTTAGVHTVTGGTGLFIETATDGKGVFVRRNSNGGGTQTGTITLQFATAIAAVATTNFYVYGIEMVWVPQGDFAVGDGSSNNVSQSVASMGAGNPPRTVTGEGAVGGDFFRNDKAPGGSDGYITAHNAIPATFPKGWAGFYCMKYEISQQQYVAFLNALTSAQQVVRTTTGPSLPAGTLAMTTPANQNRNAIVVATPATGGAPAVYATDLNGDGTYGDGDDIACNYLSWADLTAYLDWSALRPMTELEYEKAARGSTVPILNEYAWGSTASLQAISSALVNGGGPSETSTASGAGLCAFNGGASTTLGPLRVGFAATSNPSRTWSGGSFWGVMEMSGNLWEQTISIGYYNGSTRIPATYIFTGENGDGRLGVLNGDADVASWPIPNIPTTTTAAGTVLVRGGNWEQVVQRCQISDRFFVANTVENLTRVRRTGGRGVRRP